MLGYGCEGRKKKKKKKTNQNQEKSWELIFYLLSREYLMN
jgi:hypothetical protein